MTSIVPLVLVIDDDPFARSFAEVVLAGAGYRTAQAATAAAGLAMAAELTPALIILDHVMPDMTGLNMLKILRSQHGLPQTRVIMLSAWVSEDVRAAVEALDASWVAKPLSAQGLAAAAQSALKG